MRKFVAANCDSVCDGECHHLADESFNEDNADDLNDEMESPEYLVSETD